MTIDRIESIKENILTNIEMAKDDFKNCRKNIVADEEKMMSETAEYKIKCTVNLVFDN